MLVLWWAFYTILAIWLQKFLPAVDCLAPGLIVCLQLGKYRHCFWLALIWIFIQEGTGTLAFGTSILWYAGLIVFFLWNRMYLPSKSPLFLSLLLIFTAAWHWTTIYIMTNLQEVEIVMEKLLLESIQTAIVFGLLWALAVTVTSNLENQAANV